MKKIRNIGFALGLVILISANSNAQNFYTSYGYAYNWNIPTYVEYSVHNNYYGYEIAHVERLAHPGYTNYNILLHRNGVFVELRYNRHGHVYRTIRHNHYPLMAHHCNNHCGYHQNYYQAYYPKYHHVHHTKVVYVNGNNHGNGHKNHQNNYYTNVYVDNNGNGNNHVSYANSSNRQTQNTQVTRTNTVIRQPQHASRNTATYRAPQENNTRSTQLAQPTENGARTASATANRSGRGSSRER